MKLPITLLSACIFLAQFSFGQKKNKSFKKEFYFASASYELDSAELAKSSKCLKLLDKFNLTGIEIYGFADSDGNEKANLKLSQDRINTLTTLLKARGYEAKQKVEAKGEENPVYDNNTEEKFKNRRVEIIAYYSSKKRSKTSKKVKKVVKEKPVLVAAKKQEKLSVEDFKKGKTINL
ncbi:MAG: OmpA family protein, partial [Flavobacteriales bacterium]